jgi:hypothetical protein
MLTVAKEFLEKANKSLKFEKKEFQISAALIFRVILFWFNPKLQLFSHNKSQFLTSVKKLNVLVGNVKVKRQIPL